jgi:hypothetical protein
VQVTNLGISVKDSRKKQRAYVFVTRLDQRLGRWKARTCPIISLDNKVFLAGAHGV